MNCIVAVDENFGIGYNNGLLASIPEDMEFFKKTTLNKIVLMGHSTFKSLPNASVLKGRTNIILTKEKVSYPGAFVCHSIGDFSILARFCNTDEVFVIGGQAIYEQLLPYCEYAYVTKIFAKFKAGKYFPNIDQMKEWVLVQENNQIWGNEIKAKLYIYKNIQSKNILDYKQNG